MNVITRFAPSPTGFLHIGSARTALYNYLFSRHHNGKFLLRIEDTDRARSTPEAEKAIIDGLKWLGIDHDGEIVYQFARKDRHAEIAHELVAKGQAYYCYTSAVELDRLRQEALDVGKVFRFESPWREPGDMVPPEEVQPVIRIKAPKTGEILIKDQVQGDVVFPNSQLDDMVLLRSDGTPTYMLAVVVDDHDMGITHIIRGDDHLTNAARQKVIYDAMGWDVPIFAHIPLLHGSDGAKLSKRHGALGVEEYEKMGYLPEAMCNYLLRLGFSHGDEEIIPREKAIEWFTLDAVNKAPSRLDFKKMDYVNSYYIKHDSNERLLSLINSRLTEKLGRAISEAESELLVKAMNSVKDRIKDLNELAAAIMFYIERPVIERSQHQAAFDSLDRELFAATMQVLQAADIWTEPNLKDAVKALLDARGKSFKDILPIFRVLLAGSPHSPSAFLIMELLGKEESLVRLEAL